MDLLVPLNHLSTNQVTTQEEYLKWLLNKLASYLAQEPSIKDKSSLMSIVEQCLPFLGNSNFSSLWFVIVDKIQKLEDRGETIQLYQKIDHEILRLLLKGGSIPFSVLLHLWQTNLLSLEFIVISMLQHMVIGSPSSSQCTSSPKEILQKSLLIQASCHEPLIHDALQQMLMSLKKNTFLKTAVSDILDSLNENILIPDEQFTSVSSS